MDHLNIISPKRDAASRLGWQGFFPYYAGFPEGFARKVLASAELPRHSLVWDPWNGSGTTTYVSMALGLKARGFDINPVMVIVAKARLLPASEADCLGPLAEDILRTASRSRRPIVETDPLMGWFEAKSVRYIRAIEEAIRDTLVGSLTISPKGTELRHLSSLAAAFYVALFAACRNHLVRFRTSNPTWLRNPDPDRENVLVDPLEFSKSFRFNVTSMALELARWHHHEPNLHDPALVTLDVADTTSTYLEPESVDFILTSPPYCTRIDYSAATRVELAVIEPWLEAKAIDLSRAMIGSTRVPRTVPRPAKQWGKQCISFLQSVRKHRSKASAGYYFKTHVDYFNKMYQSFEHMREGLKTGAKAILVVQDSFYKDVRNPLPDILSEMAASFGLRETRRENFYSARSMAGVNRKSLNYRPPYDPVESVLCLRKH